MTYIQVKELPIINKKKKNNPILKWAKTWTDASQKKICEWQIDAWKGA